jgi:plastocyanin
MLFASAPSKVPFYIAGGLLVVWAVVLAISGIRRSDFPSSKGGRRGVIGVTFLLVLGATSMAVVTAGEDTTEGEAAASVTGEFDLAADPSGAIAYDKSEGNVEAGTVTIKLTNESSLEHNVAVAQGSRQLGVSPTIKGSETELKLDLKPGQYEFYCTIPGHRQAGMQGTLVAR